MNPEELRDQIIEQATFRRNIYDMIPDRTSRILDFGCGTGSMLLRLQRDKACTELYALEVEPAHTAHLHQFVDGVIHANIERDFSPLEKYKGFFKHIILHDVVEHFFDPWFSLAMIRSLLAEDGQILIATPNIHFWQLQYEILSGQFPYGPGLWHTGHLRWYTPISLIELLVIGGLRIDGLFLEIPGNIDFSHLDSGQEITEFQFPPKEFQHNKNYPEIRTLSYEKDISQYTPVFYAHKIIALCGKGDLITPPAPMTYNCPLLKQLRETMDLPFDVHNPPPMRRLVGKVS